MVDYTELANELLELRPLISQASASQKMSEMFRGEVFVLNYLMMHKCMAYPKELSKTMFVSTARIAALLKHMEEKGLITRQADLHDSRQIIVSITEKGLHVIEEKHSEVLNSVVQMLKMLGPEDAREYIRIQSKIVHNSIINKELVQIEQ